MRRVFDTFLRDAVLIIYIFSIFPIFEEDFLTICWFNGGVTVNLLKKRNGKIFFFNFIHSIKKMLDDNADFSILEREARGF